MANKAAITAHAAGVTTHLQALRTNGAQPHEIQLAAQTLLQEQGIGGYTVGFPREYPHHPDGQRLQVAYWNGGAIPDAVIWLK